MLDDGGTAIDPVAAIDVHRSVLAFTDHRTVDMSADDAVQPALTGGMQCRFLEVEDELQRLLDPPLGVPGQRPVTAHAEAAADQRQQHVRPDQQVVGNVAEHGDPAMMARDLVEFVTMQQQEASPVGQRMHVFAADLDVAEGDVEIIAQRFVVVTGNEHHPLAMPRPTQDLLDHSVLRRRPCDAAAHRPEIDDIADQEKVLGTIGAQEIEEPVGLARPRTEVDVGEKNGADLCHADMLRRARYAPVSLPLRFCFLAATAIR